MRVWMLCLLAALGCHEGMTMGDHEGTMESHLDAIDALVAEHVADVGALRTLEEVPAAAERHRGRMGTHLAGLDLTMTRMHACRDDGGRTPDIERMHGVDGDLEQDLASHHDRLMRAADLADARTETARHRDAMATLTMQMRISMQTMMSVSHDFDCGSCDHCP